MKAGKVKEIIIASPNGDKTKVNCIPYGEYIGIVSFKNGNHSVTHVPTGVSFGKFTRIMKARRLAKLLSDKNFPGLESEDMAVLKNSMPEDFKILCLEAHIR